LPPPGVSKKTAELLGECLLDAVALPGKSSTASELADENATTFQMLVEELVAVNRQEKLGETTRRDLKWSQSGRNVLKNVKTTEELSEMIQDVIGLREQTLTTLSTSQSTLLSSYQWDSYTVDAWCDGGYITTISRKSLELYTIFLQHLLTASAKFDWDVIKQEIDFYVKKWHFIRTNSASRLSAMCQIYVTLRNAHNAQWLSPKLEAEKMASLYQAFRALRTGGVTGGNGGEGPHRDPPGFCSKCSTILHGTTQCPWNNGSNQKAKEKARQVLKNLGEGNLVRPQEG
jgi:hypothetical protein